MTTPEIPDYLREALDRAASTSWLGDPESAQASLAAEEALRQAWRRATRDEHFGPVAAVRYLHRPIPFGSSKGAYCDQCADNEPYDPGLMTWPCPTARLVYDDDEIARVLAG